MSIDSTPTKKPLTVPPTVNVGLAEQDTATFVTLAEPIVPLPLLTVHVSPAGLV